MKKSKNKAIIAVIVIFALAFAVAAGIVIFKLVNGALASGDYEKIAGSYASDITATTESGGSQPVSQQSSQQSSEGNTVLADNPVNLSELSAQNPDIYSWICIPNTNVNYPVAQSAEDDNFYLDHDIYKGYSFPGTIYSQSCNKRDYTDRVTVLYGHNMLDGSMFATLHYFSDPQFFEENKYIYIYTKDRKLTYEVVSAYIYDDRHIMNSFNFLDDKVYAEWQQEALNPRSVSSNVRKDITLTKDDKMIVLSTCLNGGGDGRYLVQGVLVNNEQTR